MARLPPGGLAGMDPAWSRLVTARDQAGVKRTWHVLDTGADRADRPVRGTVVCVHGNPNWSYMWRRLARSLTDWRVIAVDALNMGFSERTGGQRRLADHIADLQSVTDALAFTGPVVTIAHDWGGPISLGWAQANLDRLAGVVLMNTGVARPESIAVPPLISIARSTLRLTCETTPTFLHGALRMARPQLPSEVYKAYTAPYRSAALRTGIRDFVEDIPILDDHPTHASLAAVADGLEQLQHVPALLLWGAKDIIFSDAFLHDLAARLPHAQVHRYADAGHQIIEDTDAADVIKAWLNRTPGPAIDESLAANPNSRRIWSAVVERKGDETAAIVEMAADESGGIARSISFSELDRRIEATARGLSAAGIAPGQRLATLIPPGIELTVLVYACLRAGVVVVAPDAALGLNGIRRALRSARPDYLVGDWRGLLLAKSLRLPARRLSVTALSSPSASMFGTVGNLEALRAKGASKPLPPEPDRDDDAVVVFTSGSTGPSKGVVYSCRQLEAQRDAIVRAFSIDSTQRLVVAFAPFAVLAPAIGITSVIPAIDVTAPAKLTAQSLANAARAIDATMVFASPAVLGNIAATANELSKAGQHALQQVRTLGTAGAPVSPQLLDALEPIFPQARLSTPYGMTELLPVTLASSDEIKAVGAESDTGVCVGAPLPGVDVAIRAIDTKAKLPLQVAVGALGEVWARGQHRCDRYDQLWAQQQHAFVEGWHRTGDVGHLDESGRLWIEGRVDHLIHTTAGTLAPVGVEIQAELVVGVEQAAAVGVGPAGTQQLAVVITGPSTKSGVVADPDLTAEIRAAVQSPIAAVLLAPQLPVDRRHNSKIDRTRVQTWAEAVLRGARPPRL